MTDQDPSGTCLDEQVRALILDLLEHHGWSLRELSRHSGVSPNSLSRILRRDQSPTLQVVERIFTGFGLMPRLELE